METQQSNAHPPTFIFQQNHSAGPPTQPSQSSYLVMHHIVHVRWRHHAPLVHKRRATLNLACRRGAGGGVQKRDGRQPCPARWLAYATLHLSTCCSMQCTFTGRIRAHQDALNDQSPMKAASPATASVRKLRSAGRSSRRTRSHTAPGSTRQWN